MAWGQCKAAVERSLDKKSGQGRVYKVCEEVWVSSVESGWPDPDDVFQPKWCSKPTKMHLKLLCDTITTLVKYKYAAKVYLQVIVRSGKYLQICDTCNMRHK